MKVPLIKHRKSAGQAKKTSETETTLLQLREQLASIQAGLKTSTVSHSKQRLAQAIADLDALLEESR